MKHIRVVGLCLVAVLAFGVVAVASASAAERPEFKLCGKAAKEPKGSEHKYSGSFKNKSCTEPEAGGKYELEEVPSGTKLTVKSKGSVLTVAGKVIKCKKDTGTGELIGSHSVAIGVTFEGCAVNGSKSDPCESEGAGAGKIVQHATYALVWLNEAETEPVVETIGEPTFKCGAETLEVQGDALGAIANTSKGTAITFAVNGSGEQQYKHYWNSFRHEEEEEEVRLYTEPGGVEATEATVEEMTWKGVGVY
jgi:hypothetical protein